MITGDYVGREGVWSNDHVITFILENAGKTVKFGNKTKAKQQKWRSSVFEFMLVYTFSQFLVFLD